MAKKARTPDPPRRVQAPKRRKTTRQGLDPARRRALLLYGGAAAGIAGLIVVLVIVLGGKGGGGDKGDAAAIAPTMRAAGCQFKDVAASTSGLHIQPDQTVAYDTYPPTSGQHDQASVIWGNYSQPVDPRQAVHNLEHGGLVIWYGQKISDADRTALTEFYNESPSGIIVSPIEPKPDLVTFPKHTPLTTQIALTAWTATVEGTEIAESRGVVAICPHFDGKAFAAFRDELRGKGPERFPVDSLRPGT